MRKHFFLIALIGILVYLPSLFGKFVWDDEDFVFANKYVENFQIDKFFTASITEGRGKGSNYFRPVQETVYAATHAVFGFNPFWFHLLNITVHILAACAVFFFFRNTSGFLIALFFLIHPVQTEAVSYISGLSDPLYVLFGFLSLIFFQKNKTLPSLLFFILSLTSKETAIVFLPLIFLLSPRKILPFLTAAIIYLGYHLTFINTFNIRAAWGNSPYANSIFVRLLTFIQNLPTYLGLLVFPKDLFMERDFSVSIQTNFLNITFIFFIIVITLISFFLWKLRRIHPHWKQLIICFLAFFISFLPYTGLVLINGIFYEHFLYLPLLFFFAFWLILFENFLHRQNIKLIIALIFIAFIARNISRQLDWIDPIKFYSQTLSHAPQSVRIINGLGMAYADRGDFESSIQIYSQGIKINSRVPNLYHNLANVYAAKGDYKNAEENYLKALAVDPNFFYSRQALEKLPNLQK